MQSYYIEYSINGTDYSISIMAKDVKSAKAKIGRKHGYRTGNLVKLKNVKVIGYF